MKQIQMEDFLNRYCMEYAKYTITDRAIVDLRDGCKPIHRRLIYSMYLDKLTHDKNRTKSANACSSVMRFSPHGDTSIYQAMVRLANDSVNIPLIDGKGAFSSINMRDVNAGSQRYTETRLAKITKDILSGINKNAVDFKDNYDNSLKEPIVLPVSFPLILANPNKGIATGVASTICGYNIEELCENTAKVMLKEEPSVMYPDFSTKGCLIKNYKVAEQVHETGRGSFQLRGKYHFDDNNIIFTEIPYTTTAEQIEEKILELLKNGKLKDIVDVNNFTGEKGFNITIEVKKNANKQSIVDKLFMLTPLQDNFNCNFTVLHNGKPCVLGVKDILKYWCEFRIETSRRIFEFERNQLNKDLMFLKGLEKILIDIDKCIDIIKNSKTDEEILLSLKIIFGLNDTQAEYISNMKLRSISKNNIEKQLNKIADLNKKLAHIDDVLNDEDKLRNILSKQLVEIGKEYSYERRTELIELNLKEAKKKTEELLIEDYNCVCYLTNEGYFKKVKTIANKGTNKLKDGDDVKTILECSNKDELLVFCEDLCCYKFKLYDMDETKLSNLGQYLFNETKSKVLGISVLNDASKNMLVVYKNGSVAKISLSGFETKQNRKSLSKSLHNSDVVDIITLIDDIEIDLVVNDGRVKRIDTSKLTLGKSRNFRGVKQYTWKNQEVVEVKIVEKDVDNVG